MGQDTASCPRPSSIGFMPEPPAMSRGCPWRGADPWTPSSKGRRSQEGPSPGSKAVGAREAGNISAGREQAGQAIWLLCQAAHAVPRQGRGETGMRPPPRLSHQSRRDQREEAVLRRVDSSEPEESKQYPLSSAFPWRREGAEEP